MGLLPILDFEGKQKQKQKWMGNPGANLGISRQASAVEKQKSLKESEQKGTPWGSY